MSRSLYLFNALLALVAVALGVAIVRTFLDGSPAAVTPRPSPMAADATATTAEPPTSDPAAPSAGDPDVLLRGHAFGKPLPAPVSRPPEPAPVVAPPPAPAPTLIGTMRIGDESRALLRDGSRTDLFAVGDAVAGGTLVEIHTDRVVIKRGNLLGEVSLKSSIKAEPSPAPESASASEPTEPRRRRPRPGRPDAPATAPATTKDGG